MPAGGEAASHQKHILKTHGANPAGGPILRLPSGRVTPACLYAPPTRQRRAQVRAVKLQPMMIKSLTHGPGLPPAWARDLKTSNGMLAEVNSHDWDTVRWLMGSTTGVMEVANFKGG
jgi:hypothetical protein